MLRRLAALALCLAAACPAPHARGPAATSTTSSALGPADRALDALAARFLEGWFALSPVDATLAGDHRFDARWPDLTPAGEAAYRAFLDRIDRELAGIPRAALGAQARVDAELLANKLAYERLVLDELRPAERDPVSYTDLLGSGLDPLLNRGFASKDARMASLRGRLDAIPAVVAAARARLGRPPRVHTETAIAQNAGLIALLETELPAQLGDVADRAAVEAAAGRAAAALRDLQAFLQGELLARSDGSFRLGRDLFTRKLRRVLDDEVDVDALAAQARALLVETQAAMVETAAQIWRDDRLGPLPALDTPAARKAFVKRVLDHVAEDRPTNATILADARRQLEAATAFVRAHDLVRVPTEPVAVIEMPEYRRGVAVAYCDSSGPLEAKPETFYAISPTPQDWPAARVASFYREYNQAMLADLSIHEAMPGHYLQLMHNNQFASKLRAVLASGAFAEGWAVYSEWLMARAGFGGPRVRLQQQKMALRMAANTLLDHGVHAGTMDEAEALALMTGEAFQEEGEAVGKWKRARLTSAQLTTYFYGYAEFARLRQAAERAPGFTERAYHDRLLSWGSPSMRHVRALLAGAAR